ncbi:MAG: hypothetical protein KY461_00955 [Actinobacteria bacterium]|nr:hypothetical protein [Actinomycetota bacterium]
MTGLPASVETTDPFPTTSVVVGEDPFSDWGGGGNDAVVGHALGQDLVEASIRMPDADTVEFQIEVTFLPSAGDVAGWPEASRYVWDILVDGEFVELDGRFTNYTRGADHRSVGL